MQKNIYAYTAPGADLPDYVSVNEQSNGEVVLTVRSKQTVSVTMSADEFRRMSDAIETETKRLRSSGEPVSVADQNKYGVIR